MKEAKATSAPKPRLREKNVCVAAAIHTRGSDSLSHWNELNLPSIHWNHAFKQRLLYKISTTLLSTDRVNISPYECRSLLLLIGDTKKWLKKTSTEVKSTVWLLFSGFSRIASLQLLTYYVFSQIWPFGFFKNFDFGFTTFVLFGFLILQLCGKKKMR